MSDAQSVGWLFTWGNGVIFRNFLERNVVRSIESKQDQNKGRVGWVVTQTWPLQEIWKDSVHLELQSCPKLPSLVTVFG